MKQNNGFINRASSTGKFQKQYIYENRLKDIGYNSKEEDNYDKYSASLSPNAKMRPKDSSALKNSSSDIALLN